RGSNGSAGAISATVATTAAPAATTAVAARGRAPEDQLATAQTTMRGATPPCGAGRPAGSKAPPRQRAAAPVNGAHPPGARTPTERPISAAIATKGTTRSTVGGAGRGAVRSRGMPSQRTPSDRAPAAYA